MQVIDVYNSFHDLLLYCRNNLIEKDASKDSEQIEAVKLMKKKSDDNLKSIKLKYDREIKTVNETNKELTRQMEGTEEKNLALTHRLSAVTKDRATKTASLEKIASMSENILEFVEEIDAEMEILVTKKSNPKNIKKMRNKLKSLQVLARKIQKTSSV